MRQRKEKSRKFEKENKKIYFEFCIHITILKQYNENNCYNVCRMRSKRNNAYINDTK